MAAGLFGFMGDTIDPIAPTFGDEYRRWLLDWQDRAERWQDRMVTDLASLPGTVLNPRRDAWDATWGQDLDDHRFAEQVGGIVSQYFYASTETGKAEIWTKPSGNVKAIGCRWPSGLPGKLPADFMSIYGKEI